MLNEAQQRVVSITMRRLERVLAEQQRRLQPEPPLSLSERVQDVSRDEAAELCSLAAAAEEEIRAVRAAFSLARVQESTRRVLQTTLSGLWAELEDTWPEKLNRYGTVDHDTLATLGPRIDRLILLIRSMQETLNR